MRKNGSKYSACSPPPPTQEIGSIGQNLTFSEHGLVAYKIKLDHKMYEHGSKKFARRPLLTLPPDLGVWFKRSKFNFFRTWIDQNLTFSEHDNVAYQIKWNHELQQHGSKYFARRPPCP